MQLKGKVISTNRSTVGITLSPSKPQLGAPSPGDELVKDIMAEDDSEVAKTHKRLTTKTAPPEGEPSSSSGLFTEDMTCDSQHANWNCVTKGKIHVLEAFAGSARLSQCCAVTGLKVGVPVRLRRHDFQGKINGPGHYP